MFLDLKYCPYCDSPLDGVIYVREKQVIGCENCIDSDWADFEEDEDDEEIEADMADFFYHLDKEEELAERQYALIKEELYGEG